MYPEFTRYTYESTIGKFSIVVCIGS